MINIIQWFQYKGWFIFDLPYFIREQKYHKGLELGAKAGRSMYYMLKENKDLHLTGIDLWEIIEGSAYRNNNQNENRCKQKLSKFGKRAKLLKGDALLLADNFPNETFDFIYYDLNCLPMKHVHQNMLSKWIPKIKKGGALIGRDFREFREDLYSLGYAESEIKRCIIKNRICERLEYIAIH
jgi:predicted O-methyltransferase YrrM